MSIENLSIRQVKAARALLSWTQHDLAAKSGVSYPTIARLEKEDGPLGGRSATVQAIRAALEDAGVTFTEGGVSLGGENGLSPEAVERARSVAQEINAEAAQGSGKIDETDERIQRENLKLFLWKMKLEIVADEDGRERLVLAPLS